MALQVDTVVTKLVGTQA